MALFWLFGFPVLFIFIFGTIFGNMGNSFSLKVGITEKEHTSFGEALMQGLIDGGMVEFFPEDLSVTMESVKKGKRDLALVIEEEGITVYYHPQRIEKAQVFIGYLKNALWEIESQRQGYASKVTVKTQMVGGSPFRQIDYLLPGILAMALMQLGLFGALDFVSLRERKIIRHLGVAPLRRELLLWSEIVVRMGISLLQMVLIMMVGWMFFQVKVSGSLFGTLFWVLFGSLTFVSLGYCLTSFTKTIESAEGIIQMVQFPMLFLSGIFFPPEVMPESLQFIPRLLPFSYFGDALRGTMVNIPTQFGLGQDFFVLLGWLVTTFLVAWRFFRWE
ncbi:MAG: ABC transporter permease [Candidatus Caldatribacteriaceae bacterium]